MNFAVPMNHSVKKKESEKIDKDVDLAREHKKTHRNMRLTVIPVVFGALRTIPKDLARKLKELEIGGRIGTIRTTALLRSARILRRVLET